MGRYFDKALFGKRLLELMQDNNDTTYSLGDWLELSPPTISRYTTGDISPKTPTILAIARKYAINPTWLMGTEGASKYLEKTHSHKKIPILKLNTPGFVPILSQRNIEGYENVSEDLDADFCIQIQGDYMVNARIQDGDLVYIHQQDEVENGQLVAVVINQEVVLRRFYNVGGGTVQLRSENPKYPDDIFFKKESKRFMILGKAIRFSSEVR